MKLQLIDDWKKALKLSSIWAALTGAGINGIFLLIVKGAAVVIPFFGVIPFKWFFVLMVLVCLAMGFARIVKQDRKEPTSGPVSEG